MNRVVLTLSLLALTLLPLAVHAQGLAVPPLRPTGFTVQAVGLPARAIGPTTLRARPALAAAVRVTIEDYVPRGMEPTLLIDGAPVPAASGITDVQGQVTTLSFLVENPDLLKEGATLAVQLGDDPKTRVAVPGVLRRGAIQAPDPDESRRLGLPSLAEWLSRRPGP
jgi:hypothetical protein